MIKTRFGGFFHDQLQFVRMNDGHLARERENSSIRVSEVFANRSFVHVTSARF